jgi:hypothetical protein
MFLHQAKPFRLSSLAFLGRMLTTDSSGTRRKLSASNLLLRLLVAAGHRSGTTFGTEVAGGAVSGLRSSRMDVLHLKISIVLFPSIHCIPFWKAAKRTIIASYMTLLDSKITM